jgi:hypothetical protein
MNPIMHVSPCKLGKSRFFTPGPISGIERLGRSTNLLLDVHQTPNLLKINF